MRHFATEEQVLASLVDVFRTHGYEGASLAAISRATGLARASLYHRFPNGKEEMAAAVMRYARSWLESHALAPLRDESRSPRERIEAMARELDAFYDSGRRSCLLEALSLGERGSPLSKMARSLLQLWVGEMARLLERAGLGSREAAARAEDAVVRIEGALVVARVQDDPKPFQRVLQSLPTQLLDVV